MGDRPLHGEPCGNGIGACAASGQIVCAPDRRSVKCSADAGVPAEAELCGNGIDDDCDGEIDEGYERLGEPCTNGVGACERGGMLICRPDQRGLRCDAEGGVPVPEICNNGIDDDCDGAVDDGFERLGEPCTQGLGVCATDGVLICDAATTALECDAAPPAGETELCGTGLDEDCDGEIDEGFNLGAICAVGVGQCQRTGSWVCSPDATTTECNAAAGEPSVEQCDGLDNDCDGEIDNDCIDVTPPTVRLLLPGNPILPGTIQIVVEAIDDGLVVDRFLEIDGQIVEPLMQFDTGWGAFVDFPAPGLYTLTGRALDATDNEGRATETLRVLDPGDIEFPIVAITSPANYATIGAPTDFIGTADDPNLTRWALEWSPPDAQAWIPLAEADTPIIDGVLGTLDPRDLLAGDIDIRLIAFDVNDRSSFVTGRFTIPTCESEICDDADNDCDGEIDEDFDVGRGCSAGIGACERQGHRICTADGSGTQCNAQPSVATPESCNQIDDDCDGETDEDFDLNMGCVSGTGFCARPGHIVCDGLGAAICSAIPGDPTPETCNGIDDDCDGEADEDFGLNTSCRVGVGLCAREGTPICNPAGDGTICDAVPGAPTAEICDFADNDCDGDVDEGFDADGDTVTPCNGDCDDNDPDIFADAPERCDASDNDCDGQIDEDFGLGEACTVGVGACEAPGVVACAADEIRTECRGTPGAPSAELCNGVDDDCDGETDEGFPGIGAPCEIGIGACLRAGVSVCVSDGSGIECSAQPGVSGPELCDTGIDEDCDGETDEGFEDLGERCTVGVGACTRESTVICRPDGLSTTCDAVPGEPRVELCGNGIDENCDGEIDEGFDTMGDVCVVGIGSCTRSGTQICSADGTGPICSVEPGVPAAETCNNGDDDNCDGETDEADCLPPDDRPPVVAIVVTPPVADPGAIVTVRVEATDDAGIASLTATIDGTPVELDASGQTTFSSPIAGTIAPVIARAIDAHGNAGTAKDVIRVRDPADNSPPTVRIDTPTDGEVLLERAPVEGTASDPNLLRYVLELASLSGGPFFTVAEGHVSVVDDLLGQLDPSLQKNGMYHLRLTAEDVNGRTASVEHTVRIDGRAKVGVIRMGFVDMELPVAGIALTVTRIYDSRIKTGRDFGIGWGLALREGHIQYNRRPGDGWQIIPSGGVFSLPCKKIIETVDHITEVRLSDHEVYVFGVELSEVVPLVGGSVATVNFQQIDGSHRGATLEIMGHNQVVYQSGANRLLNSDSLMPFEANTVRLHTRDGRQFELDTRRGLTRIQTADGQSVTISDGGITHSSGRSIGFERDAMGRLSTIRKSEDHAVEYTYDAAGDLVAVTDHAGRVTQFVYSSTIPHHLISIIDSDGNEAMALSYNDDGRLEQACNLYDDCDRIAYDLDAREITSTTDTGESMGYTYDARGNLTSTTNPVGGTTTYEYDTDDNLVRIIDSTGRVETRTFDAFGNVLTDTDGDGFVRRFAYDDQGNLSLIQLTSGAVFDIDRDTFGNLTALSDPDGDVLLSYEYGADGQTTLESDPFGQLGLTYNADGNLISLIKLNGETRFAHDANGRVVEMVEADGEVSTYRYDDDGRLLTTDYGNGNVIEYTYDGNRQAWTRIDGPGIGTMERRFTVRDQLGAWIDPERGETSFFYDGKGQLVRSVDTSGRETMWTYDALGLVATTIDNAGNRHTVTRDTEGRVIRTESPIGQVTQLTYTPGGRLASEQNAAGQNWLFEYTPREQRTIDPLGRTTTLVRNELGMFDHIVNPSGTRRSFTYLDAAPIGEASEYVTSVTDEAGHIRTFTYLTTGHLASASDLAGEIYEYTYGEAGLSQIEDPSDQSIVLNSDTDGRVLSITRRDGGVQRFEYDQKHLPKRVIMPSGISTDFTYNSRNQIVERRSSTGDDITLTYRPDGQIATIDDNTGQTVYHYDAMGRRDRIELSHGAELEFRHDAVGRTDRVVVRTAPGATGFTTDYEYDVTNNMVAIIDPLGGRTSMTYDAVNRLEQRTLPNGVVTEYEYDISDRISRITHRGPDNAILMSFRYVRGPLGEPVLIETEDTRAVELEYDSAMRVAHEVQLDARGEVERDIFDVYDVVGNRVERTVDGAVYRYVYDVGQQLVRVDGPVDEERYTYNADGQVQQIDRDGVALDLDYDSDGYLIEARRSDDGETVANYAHDGTGRRVIAGSMRRVVGPTPNGIVQWPHAVIAADDTLVTGYVYAGDQPILRFGEGDPIYYLTDGNNSVVGLTDMTGAIVARFEYDSFGALHSATGPRVDPPIGAGGDFRFHGQWLESDTQLYHFRAREYDPRIGRFLSRDSAEPALRMPESLHPYVFQSIPRRFCYRFGRINPKLLV